MRAGAVMCFDVGPRGLCAQGGAIANVMECWGFLQLKVTRLALLLFVTGFTGELGFLLVFGLVLIDIVW